MWLDTSLASEGICLFVDMSEAHPCLWDPESHSYLNYPVKNDLTLAYILDHAVCCASAASLGRSLHKPVNEE